MALCAYAHRINFEKNILGKHNKLLEQQYKIEHKQRISFYHMIMSLLRSFPRIFY